MSDKLVMEVMWEIGQSASPFLGWLFLQRGLYALVMNFLPNVTTAIPTQATFNPTDGYACK
jgi:hypothetical protein